MRFERKYCSQRDSFCSARSLAARGGERNSVLSEKSCLHEEALFWPSGIIHLWALIPQTASPLLSSEGIYSWSLPF